MHMFHEVDCLPDTATTHIVLRNHVYFLNFTLTKSSVTTIGGSTPLIERHVMSKPNSCCLMVLCLPLTRPYILLVSVERGWVLRTFELTNFIMKPWKKMELNIFASLSLLAAENES